MAKKIKSVYFEISNVCNARCPWCERGARKVGILPGEKHFASAAGDQRFFATPEVVHHTLKKLLDAHILDPNAQICLYNWGEPTLNPQFREILAVIKSLKLYAGISTNGSNFIDFAEDELSHVKYFCVSIPGISQDSYDKVHGFRAAAVQKNIEKMVSHYYQCGLQAPILVYMHLYAFNLHEASVAKKIFSRFNVTFGMQVAFLNSYELWRKYLDGALDRAVLQRINHELFVFPQGLIQHVRPEGYECPQYESLTISHRGKLSLCCGCRLGPEHNEYEICDFDGLTLEDIYQVRKRHETCQSCRELGIDYMGTAITELFLPLVKALV